jgi:hypothetical protein
MFIDLVVNTNTLLSIHRVLEIPAGAIHNRYMSEAGSGG